MPEHADPRRDRMPLVVDADIDLFGAEAAAADLSRRLAAVEQPRVRHAVGPKAHRITVRLPEQPKLGIVRIPLRLKPRGGGQSGSATLIVLRG